MVKMIKKIEAKNAPLSVEDQNKINVLLKTYDDGEIKFYTSFSGLHDPKVDIKTLEDMEVLLTSDSLEKLKRLGNEFDAKINENLGDKVIISSSNILD